MLPVSTPPASTVAATPTVAGGVTPVEVAVTTAPATVDQLQRQIQVGGTVAATAGDGTLTLATALGSFALELGQLPEAVKQQILQQLENLLQNQKPATLLVQPGTPPTQALLLLPSTTAPTQALPSVSLQTPLPPPTLSAGASFAAVILPPDIALPNAPAPPVTAQQGGPPESASGNAPVETTTGTAVSPQNVAASSPSQTAAQPAAQAGSTAAPLAALLQPGKEVIVHVDAVANAATPLPGAAANQLAATVIGNGTNGQLILKAGDATLYVRSSIDAPVGASLLISLEPPKSVAPMLVPPAAEPTFTGLQQVLTALAQIDPQLARQIIALQIPQPSAPMAAPLLFLLSAMKQGDARGWLGSDAADALTRSGKLELLAKLAHELGSSTQSLSDPTVGEWKSTTLPLYNAGQFQTLTLHVHADGRGAAAAGTSERPNQIRFLIDVRMSRFGPMQLDGLVRPKKLDMIIRSEKPLPLALPADLRATYISTVEALGYTGGLSFQTGRQHWLLPRKTAPQSVVT